MPREDPDAVIHRLAADQHGLVTRRQLIQARVPGHTIEYRLERGRLERVHRSVYRVGPLRSAYEREMAAVLACGTGSVLSYSSAAALWQLLAAVRGVAVVDVTVVGRCSIRDAGIRVHRGSLGAGEATLLHGIPITSAARTLLDIASVVSARELEQALAQAERERLVTRAELEQLLSSYPRRHGTVLLRALLGSSAQPAFTRSEAEARFIALVRKAQLNPPESNVMIAGYEVDFLWRSERLVVEVDGQAFHAGRTAFERDRRRDAVLTAAGLRVMRVTWQQLSTESTALLVRVAQALARAPL